MLILKNRKLVGWLSRSHRINNSLVRERELGLIAGYAAVLPAGLESLIHVWEVTKDVDWF
jgi:hypothetical protein